MTFYRRALSLPELLGKKSFFLFGPRATGKSFLIAKQLGESACIINLLQSDIYLRLLTNPALLEGMIMASQKSLVVVDEIQRIPALLNEVHRLIESHGITFLLTGSSTRTLKGAGINLLAGRAWEAHLFPLTRQEIPEFDLARYLQYGGLPAVYNSKFPEEELHAYVNTYLKDEIQSEALVRKIPAFSRFLQVSALTSGQIVNYTTIARESSVPAATVREYFSILEDTLLGFVVPAWTKSVKRKAIAAPKFYYFDCGVRNTLAGIYHLDPHSNLYGQAFEHFIMLELRAYLDYRRIRQPLAYWRSTHGHEVDVLIGNELAIEIKTTTQITNRHCKGLMYLAEEKIVKRFIALSHDPIAQTYQGIEAMHYEDFLDQLWQGKIV
jgi:predicted AAA+ superfamily ATPase